MAIEVVVLTSLIHHPADLALHQCAAMAGGIALARNGPTFDGMVRRPGFDDGPTTDPVAHAGNRPAIDQCG